MLCWSSVLLIAVLVSCTEAGPEESPLASAPGTGDCAVTIPEPLHVPPTHPETPPAPDAVWFGTHELWTVLDADGSYRARKSVWWSARFPGGAVEEMPELRVVWNRLDVPGQRIESQGRATNAHSGDSGDFMIARIQPPTTGCWEVSATYKNATLIYVVDVP